MRVVFMGTPDIAVPVLKALAAFHDVVGVYTRPDSVRKRGNALIPSPIKAAALELGLDVYCPKTLRDEAEVEALRALRPDVICVMAYGAILTQDVLDIPPFGCLNVHGSLLPRWRGAAPIERAILAGDAYAGVCVMRMERGLDTGDYCNVKKCVVGDKDQAALSAEISQFGAQALIEALDVLASGRSLDWVAQDESRVTYAEKIGQGELDLSADDGCVQAVAKICASSEAHPSHANIAGKSVIVLRAQVACDDLANEVGQGLSSGEARFVQKRLLCKAQDGCFEVLECKPAGKKAMDARAFAAGIQGVKNSILIWGN